MDAAIDNLESQSLVHLLRVCVVEPGVGGHLDASMTARPMFGLTHQGSADSVPTSWFVDEPAFDKANGLGGVAAVGVRA